MLFGDRAYFDIYVEAMQAVGRTMWLGDPPVFVNVDMRTGNITNQWADSLQACVT